MNSEEEIVQRQLAFSLLEQKNSYGILSTASSDVVSGYPLGSPLPYVLNANNEIVIIANDIAEYRRNFGINEKVCFTVLKQGDSTSLVGLNYFGKVKKINVDEYIAYKNKFISEFPIAKHILQDESNKMYRIELTKLRYFDNKSSKWINTDRD